MQPIKATSIPPNNRTVCAYFFYCQGTPGTLSGTRIPLKLKSHHAEGSNLKKIFFSYRNEWLWQPWLFTVPILGSMPNADQCRSIPLKIMALIRNSSQCRWIPINSSQRRPMPIERNWSELISIDQNWATLGSMPDFDRHWSTFGLERGSPEIYSPHL